jgi:ubiquitin C-terminal hydrolase
VDDAELFPVTSFSLVHRNLSEQGRVIVAGGSLSGSGGTEGVHVSGSSLDWFLRDMNGSSLNPLVLNVKSLQDKVFGMHVQMSNVRILSSRLASMMYPALDIAEPSLPRLSPQKSLNNPLLPLHYLQAGVLNVVLNLDESSVPPEGVSFANSCLTEAEFVAQLIAFCHVVYPKHSLLVVTLHSIQRDFIRHYMRKDALHSFPICAIEDAVGQEADLVIVCFGVFTVSNLPTCRVFDSSRMKVAFTRAKRLCILVTTSELDRVTQDALGLGRYVDLSLLRTFLSTSRRYEHQVKMVNPEGGHFVNAVDAKLPGLQFRSLKPKSGPGLVNLGNTCFLNAPLQLLLVCEEFLDACLKFLPVNIVSSSNHDDVSERVCYEFCRFILSWREASLNDEKALSPHLLIEGLKTCERHLNDSDPNKLFLGQQQDAEQLLCLLLEKLEKGFELISERKRSSGLFDSAVPPNPLRYFNFELCSHLQCNYEGCTPAPKRDPSKRLCVELPPDSGPFDLKPLIVQQLTQLEDIGEWTCDVCKKDLGVEKRGCTKTHKISALPKYLFVLLKRFEYSNITHMKRKITSSVIFNETLNLEDVLSSKSDGCFVKFLGMLLHSGTLDGGHYRTIVRSTDDQYVLYSDESRQNVSGTDVFEKHIFSQDCIMILYEHLSTNSLFVEEQVIRDRKSNSQLKMLELTKTVRAEASKLNEKILQLQKRVLQLESLDPDSFFPDKPGFVYIFYEKEGVARAKVGNSKHPDKRLLEGRTFCPRLGVFRVSPRFQHKRAAEERCHEALVENGFERVCFLDSDEESEWFVSTATDYGSTELLCRAILEVLEFEWAKILSEEE